MATWPLVLRRATEDDQEVIIDLIHERADWLRTMKLDQWSQPWPTRAGRDSRIQAALLSGKTWIGWDDGTPAATLSADPDENPFWPDELRRDPAVYIHRLVVSRPYAGAGLGGQLLDWAGLRARNDHGALWIRVNAWTTNDRLHDYYRRQGFAYCGLCPDDGYPSAAMFQKATDDIKPDGTALFQEEPLPPPPAS